jgi:C4-type Zn-finger protein
MKCPKCGKKLKCKETKIKKALIKEYWCFCGFKEQDLKNYSNTRTNWIDEIVGLR